MGDKSKSKLFVGGLGQNATENNLYGTFDKFGKIEDGKSRSACISLSNSRRTSTCNRNCKNCFQLEVVKTLSCLHDRENKRFTLF